jgi:DNA-binding NarL/FixJ family response regulator
MTSFASTAVVNPKPVLVPFRVLLVVSDLGQHLELKRLLSAQPHLILVGAVTDGLEALRLLRLTQPDLVLIDLELQSSNGIVVTQQIKKMLPSARVILMKPAITLLAPIAILRSGADAYYLKNREQEQLLTAIAAVQEGALYLDTQMTDCLIHQFNLAAQRRNYCLSARELEVIEHITDGKTNNRIAKELHLSCSTVKTYIQNIMVKLSVNNRVEIAIMALRLGLVKQG